jgi:hypothetical protein
MTQTGGLVILYAWLIFAGLLAVLAYLLLRHEKDPLQDLSRPDPDEDGHHDQAESLLADYPARRPGAGSMHTLLAELLRDQGDEDGQRPGPTPSLARPACHAKHRPGVPLGRPGDAREIAAVIAFLASAQASYVTGASWPVDGGMLQMGPQAGSHISTDEWRTP